MSVITPASVPDDIALALRTASKRTGTGFEYLMQTAMRESGLNSAANASTSSAVGLFQFIEGTWMETLKETGAKHGLDEVAAAIRKTPSGRYEIADPDTKAAILALRTDPGASALMAGELAHSNAEKLQSKLGRTPTDGELYIAHFLGAGGAGQLIVAASQTPDEIASAKFPAAARANPSIFYNRGGRARSVGQVYRNLIANHRNTAVATGTAKPNQVSGGTGSGANGAPLVDGAPLDITPDLAKAGLSPRLAASQAVMGRAQHNPAVTATGYASVDKPLYRLFLEPVSGGGEEVKPTKQSALVATLKAYGMQPGANNSGSGESGFQASVQGRAKPGTAPPWGGGLFTNAPVKPMAGEGGLFTSRPLPANAAR